MDCHTIYLDEKKNANSIPTSQTCHFKLYLVNYPSEEIMNKQFLYAFANCRTIDGDDTGATNAADVDPALVRAEEEAAARAREQDERGSDSDENDSDGEGQAHRHARRNRDDDEEPEEEREEDYNNSYGGGGEEE